MQVETYEVEEIKNEAGILAADHEASELINKLGLDGQKKLLNAETVTRFPYRKMYKNEALIYGILCPSKTKLEEYSDEPIPLRILQVAAHAKELGFCDYLEVWHPENADVKDPVLVGIKGSSWSGERFMLARWGKELLPMDQLEVLARKMALPAMRKKLNECKTKLDAYMASIDENTPIERLCSNPMFCE